MKVLSEWYRGTPPRPGLWLVRHRTFAKWSRGTLYEWDGVAWRFTDGMDVWFDGPIEWRGLAFDPEAATYCYGYTGGADAWIVTEPKP